MRAEIIRFTKLKRKKAQPSKLRRRVFYTGYRYVGPVLCQDEQQIYLKRHGNEEWSLIFYFQGRSWELDRFAADELLSKLHEHLVEALTDYDSLEAIDWCNPDRDNIESLELHYWERYPDRFYAVCFGRLPHDPFENHECD